MDDEKSLQDVNPGAEPQPGSESNQTVAVPAVGEQPGVEDVLSSEIPTQPAAPAKPARTYTEQDIQAIQSAKDIEIRQRDEILNNLAMEQHIRQLQAKEQAAQNSDKQAIETGTMTTEDAQERAKARYEKLQLDQTLNVQRGQAEALGRLQAGYDLGIKYGIDPQTLINDQKIKTYPQMLEKATELGYQILKDRLRTATAKTESFDRGSGSIPSGGMGTFTRKQIADMPIEQYIKNRDAIEKAYQAGRIK